MGEKADYELLETLFMKGTVSAKGREDLEEFLRKKWLSAKADPVSEAKAPSQFQQEMADWMPRG